MIIDREPAGPTIDARAAPGSWPAPRSCSLSGNSVDLGDGTGTLDAAMDH